MKVRRALFAAVGVLVLSLVVTAGVGTNALPVDAAIDLLGNDYLLVASVAGAGLLVAIPALASGRAANLNYVEMPTPERPTTAPPPGVEFDEACRRPSLYLPVVGARRRNELRDRLRQATVAALVRTTACDRDEARQRVASGEWTDDAAVAAFLAGDRPHGPLGRRLRALAGGETWFVYLVRRTVVELDGRVHR